MSSKGIVGVYDSLAEAEKAEFHLEELRLPVGQMSLLALETDGGEVEGDVTAPQVANAAIDAGVRLSKEQTDEYERLLDEGKVLLIFAGDVDQVAQAHRALEHTNYDDLAMVGG